MAEFPAFPLWTDAYLGDTLHLTTTEHGAYLLLLMVAWRSPSQRLPDDDKLLARYTKLSGRQWARMKPVISEFFVIENGYWLQPRLLDEYNVVRRQLQQRSDAGKASALKRKERNQRAFQRNGNGSATPTPTPTPTPTIPLAKANGAETPDSDRIFWANAKAYLAGGGVNNPGALIGKWIRDYERQQTAEAITAAQLERAVEPVSYIERCLRVKKEAFDRDDYYSNM